MIKHLLTVIFLAFSIIIFSQEKEEVTKKEALNINENYKNFRFGGYGEILFQNFDYEANRYNPLGGARSTERSEIDIPRFIVSYQYKFTPTIELVTEIEFEHGGTGASIELEYDESGEYETEIEKGGEVVLEQFHISKKIYNGLTVRAGHMIVPMGSTNKRHMPYQFFTSVRPEGEGAVIPLTWHETGISILGKIKNWNYEFQLINGLEANGFSKANWVGSGRQTKFEKINMTNPAFVGRIENNTFKNLTLAASYYQCNNSAGNGRKPENMKKIHADVKIGSFNFDYISKNFIARGNFIYGDLTDSRTLFIKNLSLAKGSQYPKTAIGKNAMTYSLEAGYNIFKFFKMKTKLFLFGRYDYYNTMEEVATGVFQDKRYERQVFTVGLNYLILPTLVLKTDYSHRKLETINSENTFSIALVYSGWFVQK